MRRLCTYAFALAALSGSALADDVDVVLEEIANLEALTDVTVVKPLAVFPGSVEGSPGRLNVAAAVEWNSPDPLWLVALDSNGKPLGDWFDTKLAPSHATTDGSGGYLVAGVLDGAQILRRYQADGRRVWSQPAGENTSIAALHFVPVGASGVVVATTQKADDTWCLQAYKVEDGSRAPSFGTDSELCLPTPPGGDKVTTRLRVRSVQPLTLPNDNALVIYASLATITWNGPPPAEDADNSNYHVTSITSHAWVGVASSSGSWTANWTIPFDTKLFERGTYDDGSDSRWQANRAADQLASLTHVTASVDGDKLTVLGIHRSDSRDFLYQSDAALASLTTAGYVPLDDNQTTVREVLLPRWVSVERVLATPTHYYVAGTRSNLPWVAAYERTLLRAVQTSKLTLPEETHKHEKLLFAEVLDESLVLLSKGDDDDEYRLFRVAVDKLLSMAAPTYKQ